MGKLLVVLALLAKVAVAKGVSNHFVLNEDTLSMLLKNKNPTLEKINLIYETNVLNRLKFDENFSYNLSAGVSSFSSDDKGEPSYDTQLFTDTKQANIGVNKNSSFGMNFGANFYTGEYSMNMPMSGTYDFGYSKSGVKISYGIDLWKNFLGYQTYSKEVGLRLGQKQSKIKEKIELSNYYYSARSLYWQIYTKKQEIAFYEAMVVEAEKMYENIKKMYKSYVVDKRDIARAEANFELKKFNLNSAKLEFTNLEMTFKKLFPELIEKNVILSEVNIEDVLKKVKNCNSAVENMGFSWEENTSYTEYVKYMDDMFKMEEKSLNRYSDVDIKLNFEADLRGTDKDTSSSIRDMRKYERNDYRVSLNINKILDNTASASKKQQLKISRMNFNINKNETLANVEGLFQTYGNMMRSLLLMQQNISKSKNSMEIRVRESVDKYNKGMISLNDLISDNDSLIQTNINLIKINTNIITVAIQYLSIFDKVVCDLVLK